MYFDSAVVGLILIAIGWLLQLISSWDGSKRLKKRFVIVQNLGFAWLVVDSIVKGNASLAIFNAVVLVIASILLVRLGKNDAANNRTAARTTKRKIRRR